MNKFLICFMLLTSLEIISERHLTEGQQRVISIAGSVTYPDGRPAAGARVYRYRSDNPTGLQGGTISQADGSFALNDLEPGTLYDVCASKTEEGYLDPSGLPFGLPVGGHCRQVMLRPGVNPGKITLKLGNKAGMLSGHLLDARTHRPIVNGKVTLYRPLRLESDTWVLADPKRATWVPSVVDETDATGKFSFSNLPEGLFFLRVEAAGYRNWFYWNQSTASFAQPLQIRSGKTRSVVAALQLSGH